MPGLKTHCAISKKRTGFDFKELHQWIDSSSKEMGYNHRQLRHASTTDDERTIRDYWDKKKPGLGQKTVVEFSTKHGFKTVLLLDCPGIRRKLLVVRRLFEYHSLQ